MRTAYKAAVVAAVVAVIVAATLHHPSPVETITVCGVITPKPVVKRVELQGKVGHAVDWRTGEVLIDSRAVNYTEVYQHELAHLVVDNAHQSSQGHTPEFYAMEAYLKGALTECPNG